MKKLEEILEEKLKIYVVDWDLLEVSMKYDPDRVKVVLEGAFDTKGEVKMTTTNLDVIKRIIHKYEYRRHLNIAQVSEMMEDLMEVSGDDGIQWILTNICWALGSEENFVYEISWIGDIE
ncbi:MAG: hypothetical protein SVK08_01220 [Halobacteriota archaeon]|nr:hypothetical protein [Halobacteriota archaeon]